MESVAAGTLLCVRAQPGARKCGVIGEYDGALRIAVTAPPDKGKANEAIIAVLADAFDLPKSAIELVSGQASRQKKFLLNGTSTEDAQRIIVSLLDA